VTNLRYQLGLVAILAVAISAAAQASSPDLATIVDRMTQAQLEAHNSIRPYEVTREYKFFQGVEDDSPDSHVVADVTYFPPDSKQFSIVNATGGGRGQHVVKKVLEQETQMSGQWRQSALTDENYKFSLMGEGTLNGRRCFILGLEPRRDAKEVHTAPRRVGPLVDEPHPCLVDELRRLQRVSLRLAAQRARGLTTQLVVHERREGVERGWITGTPGSQESGDVGDGHEGE